jgi:ubiquinone/menaquinone biosynthesis C-methylase UbiE
MDRVLEPELMDEEEQARAYAEGDFAEAHDRHVGIFLRSWPAEQGPIRGPILDLGCGPGDVTLRIARACPEAVIHGVDGSAAMLRHGRERVAAEGLADRVTLVEGFLPRDAPPLSAYPVVVSSSLLHHLHDPSVLWESVRRFGAPGAFVFVVDLRRPDTPADVDRMLDTYAAGAPEILRRDYAASLFAAFTLDEVQAQLRGAGLNQLAVEPVSDQHMVVRGTLA